VLIIPGVLNVYNKHAVGHSRILPLTTHCLYTSQISPSHVP